MKPDIKKRFNGGVRKTVAFSDPPVPLFSDPLVAQAVAMWQFSNYLHSLASACVACVRGHVCAGCMIYDMMNGI